VTESLNTFKKNSLSGKGANYKCKRKEIKLFIDNTYIFLFVKQNVAEMKSLSETPIFPYYKKVMEIELDSDFVQRDLITLQNNEASFYDSSWENVFWRTRKFPFLTFDQIISHRSKIKDKKDKEVLYEAKFELAYMDVEYFRQR
jgi:hypothetical protein